MIIKKKKKKTKKTRTRKHLYNYEMNGILSVHIRGSLNKFPDFFHMGTFIDSTHMKL